MKVEIHGTPEELLEKGPKAFTAVAEALIAQGVDPWLLVKAVLPLSISHEIPESPVSHGLIDQNRHSGIAPHPLPVKTEDKKEVHNAAREALKAAPAGESPKTESFVRQEPLLNFKTSVEDIDMTDYLSDLKQYVLQYAKDRENR